MKIDLITSMRGLRIKWKDGQLNFTMVRCFGRGKYVVHRKYMDKLLFSNLRVRVGFSYVPSALVLSG